MHISFVILHYITLEDTVECIQSIKENIDYKDYSIVVVDNGSPNKSGEELIKKYSGDKKINIILSKENLGFAKGNNIGFVYAKYEKKADFIAMINNDTIINQKDFIIKLIEDYEVNKYHICGPNIISLIDNQKQNPIPRIFSNSKQVKKFKLKFQLLLFMNYFRVDDKFEKFLSKKGKGNNENIDYKDIQLHGSAMIFSPEYIKKYEGLYDKTFMYIEECILKYIADRDDLKIHYCKDITIYHKEDSSTNAYLNNGYMKRRFFYKNSIDSCKILYELMEQG